MNRPTVVVITGASGGIGSALARGYAGPGVTLGLIGRDGKRLEPIAAQCRAQGAAVEVLVADVTQAEAMRRTLQDFDRQHPIGLLIANAGVNSGRTPDGAPFSLVVENYSGVLIGER